MLLGLLPRAPDVPTRHILAESLLTLDTVAVRVYTTDPQNVTRLHP